MEREERRRKILSRGSDRLAVITGRIQTTDPNPLSKSSTFSYPHPNDQTPPPDTQHARSSSDGPFFKEYCSVRDSTLNATITKKSIDEGCRKGNSTQQNMPPNLEEKSSSEKILTPRFTRPSNTTRFPEDIPLLERICSITPKEINFSIISSENTRVVCSVVIAILVVMSHVSLPHKVVKSKSLIAYRPLYVVLMTDVLIVAGRLALFAQRREEDGHQNKEAIFNEDGYNWGGAVKLLEFGLVIHQILRGIFIDCSFYLVIVICGLSLV